MAAGDKRILGASNERVNHALTLIGRIMRKSAVYISCHGKWHLSHVDTAVSVAYMNQDPDEPILDEETIAGLPHVVGALKV